MRLLLAGLALALFLPTVAFGASGKKPIVVVDPGHDALPNLASEPIGPGSTTRKIKDGGGTRGVVSRTPESVVTLAISKQLRKMLRRAGAEVVMTRRKTASVSLGNIARAQIANRAGAKLFVRIHADGSTSPARRGTHTLHPALRAGWTDDIYRPSRRAARLVQTELVRRLGSRDLGLQERSDITGFNWADVPAILVEVGFMTNPTEDRLLNRSRYRERAAAGICRGIVRFLRLGTASECRRRPS